MKIRFFKVTITIISLLLLFSCGKEKSIQAYKIGLLSKKLVNFTIKVPNSWIELNDNSWELPKPNFWEISLAMSSTKNINWFSNNLLILKDKLDSRVTSIDFSRFSNIWIKEDYVAYKELSQREITFIDEDKSVLYTFEARYNKNTPRLKFLQTAHICKSNSYLLTIALSSLINDTSKYEYILESFKCNNEIKK